MPNKRSILEAPRPKKPIPIGLNGACVWVTGATSGIGRALVVQLVEAGNFVIASGRNKEALGRLAAELGCRVKILPFDVTESDMAVTRAALQEITDYLDCVIACAGICEYEDTLDFEPDKYQRVFETNFLGVIRTLHLAKPLLLNSQVRGQFVAIGSLSSVLPFPRAQAYGAAKAALEYFVKSARIDLSRHALDMTLVRPGFVSTPLVSENDFAMPFMITPEQAARRIITGVNRRKALIDFPRRLSWPLRFLSLFDGLWVRFVGPKITRV
ncbi:SDR family NAD(P)-dependent oxidoreductase [Marinagarivorans algicola]|uniref:SDR family NAD(P)-dependent oxidoreductase n=1 Tax=Marinagarivorans algicola TaxID=1513270 RepID=UPI0009E72646|nr:SDR family NAD(P)-dependent oxidoreductase [Marinagarivorans algicola]